MDTPAYLRTRLEDALESVKAQMYMVKRNEEQVDTGYDSSADPAPLAVQWPVLWSTFFSILFRLIGKECTL